MLLPVLAFAPMAYRIVDLGLPPGAGKAEAVAINNRNEVLVSVPSRITGKNAQGEVTWRNGRGYLWRAGRFLDFGEPLPSKMFDPIETNPSAVNDLSVAVGSAGTGHAIFQSGLIDVNPFIWRGKGMEELGTGWSSEPRSINDLGDVVGTSEHRGFARLRGKILPIGTFSHVPAGNSSTAVAINAHRLILGTSTYGGTPGERDFGLPTRSFTADGSRLPLLLKSVPVPKGCGQVEGLALNDSGSILALAFYRRGEKSLTYLVRHGRIVPLPFAGAMNGRDEVVGGSPPALWRNGRTIPLPTFPGWTLTSATGINDKGAICGTGQHDGKARAYLLVPFAGFGGRR